MSEKIVLCGANSYEQKYYFNKEQFGKLPEDVQNQLHIFTICFDEAGNLQFETDVADNDYLFDEIGAGLLIREIERNRAELLHSLELYYKVFILHESVEEL